MGVDLGLGSAFMNALSPSKNKTIEFRPSSFANEIELDGIVPRYYGKNLKVYPKHAAQPYTLNYGNDIRLHCIFILGYGPLGISDIRIGNKPIDSFSDDIEYEIRNGSPSDSPITLFTQDVNQTDINQQIQFGSTIQGELGLCNYALIDLFFPRGMYQVLTLPTGSGSQVQLPTALTRGIYVTVSRKDTGTVVYAASTILNENIQGPFYRTISIPNLASAEYKITIERAQAPGDQSVIVDDVQCLSIKGVKYGSPIVPYRDAGGNKIGISYIAVRAKGSAKTQGVMGALNCKVTSRLQTYSGGVWTEVASSAPADVIADLLCGTVNTRPIPRARLNGPAFAAFKAKTEALGYSWNEGFEKPGELLEDAIEAVAFAGRGLYLPRDASGLHSVRFEEANDTIDNIVGPWNSRGLKVQKVNGDIPHAIKGIWISAAEDHLQEETIIPRPGYTATSATTFESISFRGVNNHDQVYRLAQYHWAAALYRGTTYEFEMNNEYRLLNIGSRIKYANDSINYGVGDGLIKSIITNGSGDCTGIIVNEPLEMADNKEYAVRIRCNDGTLYYKQINNGNGLFTTLTFKTVIPNGQTMPAARDLYLVSYLSQEADLIVAEIIPGEDLTASIICLDYAEVIYSAASGTLPPYSPPVTIPERAKNYIPPVPQITGILSDENVMLQYGTTLIPRIKVSYTTPPSDRIRQVQIQWKREDETEFANTVVIDGRSGEYYILDVREGVTYDIQLYSVADNTYRSEPIRVSHKVVGRTTPPPDVSGLFPFEEDFSIIYTPPIDFSHFIIKANNGVSKIWSDSQTLLPQHRSYSFPRSILPSGEATVLVKAVDTSGNESANAFALTMNFGLISTSNVFLQDGYPGPTGTFGAPGQFVYTKMTISPHVVIFNPGDGYYVSPSTFDGKFWSGNPAGKFWRSNPAATFWGGGRFKDIWIELAFTPPGDLAEPWILKFESLVLAENYAIQYQHSGKKKFWSGGTAGGSKKFWSGNPTETFWEPRSEDQWKQWLGQLKGTRRVHRIRILVPGGQEVRPRVGRFLFIADMPDLEESFVSLLVSPSGTAVPLTKAFRRITEFIPILQVDPSYPDAANVQILDAPPYSVSGGLGPRVQVFDNTNTPTTGVVSGRVKGW